ncbi:BhlA/UviB family holin-like peptide [Bacillus sp. FSL W8-0645]
MSKSEEDVVQNFKTQGSFAVLFCILFYVLNTTKEREHKFNAQ